MGGGCTYLGDLCKPDFLRSYGTWEILTLTRYLIKKPRFYSLKIHTGKQRAKKISRNSMVGTLLLPGDKSDSD